MKRALIAAAIYFLVLFALGFALGTVRVLLVTPRLGTFAATLAEAPLMIAAGFFTCRWAVKSWQVPPMIALRGAMVVCFLMLLVLFETVLGVMLFGRTLAELGATLTTPAGLLGLASQGVAAFLPLLLWHRK